MKKIYILSALVLAVILVSFGVQQIIDAGKYAGYQKVAIKELISDTTKYDGQKVLVTGMFTDMRHRGYPACTAFGTGENPEIRDAYVEFTSTWGVSNKDGRIVGVEVLEEKGAYTSTLPNYKTGQKIKLKGIARSTTVADFCSRDILYRSVYLEVNAKDIDITLRPHPPPPIPE